MMQRSLFPEVGLFVVNKKVLSVELVNAKQCILWSFIAEG